MGLNVKNFSVTVPVGCFSQGCHGYFPCSACSMWLYQSNMHLPPCLFIVDEFKYLLDDVEI